MSTHPRSQGRPGREVFVAALCVMFAIAAVGWAAAAAAQQQDAKASYEKLCAACHGATGRGNGPVAAALTPRPTSFADTTIASRTDDELAKVIAEGKPPMPAFGKQLDANQIKAVIQYIRELGTGRRSPGGASTHHGK